jgi:hypothetical protein
MQTLGKTEKDGSRQPPVCTIHKNANNKKEPYNDYTAKRGFAKNGGE